MSEPVRLVIWDLDETFWKGTHSEGGIEKYIQEHHDLVIALSERGIMNSICSKNDYGIIKEILISKGIWEYFIFPSIDWSSKSQRVKTIIHNVQLRPESVIFIDDNAGNRAEVLSGVPGIRVESEFFIETITNDPLFSGKEDSMLSRLRQYKILESKSAEKGMSASDNLGFLKNSEIRITVEHNVEANIARAVELVNRTNQLNFTKNRLPEGQKEAAQVLLKQLTDLPYARTAGLIKVQDKYGNYGYCGFYLCEQFHTQIKLIHFCFSCRTLGMGVEKWVYQRLGRPLLEVKGEVIADVFEDGVVDWIKLDDDSIESADLNSTKEVPQIFLRGGCDLDAVAHYLRYHTDSFISETNFVREGQLIRKDSLVNIVAGMNNTFVYSDVLTQVGLRPDDFHARFLNEARPGDVVVLSLWAELMLQSYKHSSLPLHILIQLRGASLNYAHASAEKVEEVMLANNVAEAHKSIFREITSEIRSSYSSDFYNRGELKAGMEKIVSTLPQGVTVIIMMPAGKIRNHLGQLVESATHQHFREDVLALQHNNDNVFALDVMSCIEHEGELIDVTHFSRMVYHRIYLKALDIIRGARGACRLGSKIS